MPPKKTMLRPKKPATMAKKPPVELSSTRGVSTWREAAQWLKVRGIEDIECITPDLAGVARGKMMPTA